jgi:hypothetical protein
MSTVYSSFELTNTSGEKIMCLDKIIRNFGFALASVAIVAVLGFTIEYQPVINALAR